MFQLERSPLKFRFDSEQAELKAPKRHPQKSPSRRVTLDTSHPEICPQPPGFVFPPTQSFTYPFRLSFVIVHPPTLSTIHTNQITHIHSTSLDQCVDDEDAVHKEEDETPFLFFTECDSIEVAIYVNDLYFMKFAFVMKWFCYSLLSARSRYEERDMIQKENRSREIYVSKRIGKESGFKTIRARVHSKKEK